MTVIDLLPHGLSFYDHAVIYTSLSEIVTIKAFNGSLEQSNLFHRAQWMWLEYKLKVAFVIAGFSTLTNALNSTVSLA